MNVRINTILVFDKIMNMVHNIKKISIFIYILDVKHVPTVIIFYCCNITEIKQKSHFSVSSMKTHCLLISTMYIRLFIHGR